MSPLHRVDVKRRVATRHAMTIWGSMNLSAPIVVLLLSACTPEPAEGVLPVNGFHPDGDAGGLESPVDSDAGIDPEPWAYAVLASDYMTTSSISLLRPDGTMLAPRWIHSGSASAGLVTALSGDVTLPTRSGDSRVLTLIDRWRTDVVTRVDPRSGVLGQVKTHQPNDENQHRAYSSNPQDYIYLDAANAWVSRYEPNVGADAQDPDKGNDLLHLDPTRFERTGRRIDFDALNGRVTRHNPQNLATQEVVTYARPSRMVRLGDYLVVGLTRMSRSFDAIDDGMVALVDLETEQVSGVHIPGLQSCGNVVPVPDDPTRVAVACSGFRREMQRRTAGLAMLRLAAGELLVEHLWQAASDPNAALTVGGLVALSDREVIAVEEEEDTPDRVYRVDLATGAQTLVFEADGSYKVGTGVYNPRRRLLLIPDGSTDAARRPTAGVRSFHRTETGAFEARGVLVVDDILPPRQIAPL